MSRSLPRIAFAMWVLSLALTAAGLLLLLSNRPAWPSWVTAFQNGFAVYLLPIAYGTVGLVILRQRPGNLVGWTFSLAAFLTAFTDFTSEYAVHALVTAPGSLPGAVAIAVIQKLLFFPVVFPFGFGLLLLLFPDGKLPSRRWRPWLWIAAADTCVIFAANLVVSEQLTSNFRDVNLHLRSPTGVVPQVFYSGPASIVWIAQMGWLLIGAAGIAVRMVRSRGAERLQLKWLVYAGLLTAAGFIVGTLPIPGVPSDGRGNNLLFAIGVAGACIGFPLATAVAVLRYRLYDIDFVISRTLLLTLMAAFIGAVYIAIVVGIGYLLGGGGRPNLTLSIIATAVVAVAFQPVREAAEKLANRLVYGRQRTPYEVLAQFSDQVAVYGRPDLLIQIARAVADGIGAAAATVWVKEDGRLVRKAQWPENGDGPSPQNADRLVEVKHLGAALGAIAVAKGRTEPLTPVEQKLLEELAAQAGPVIHNVSLNDELSKRLQELSDRELELRRSRQRIVAAQDAERRRLERNIHDGAQQHLVALAVKLRLARTFATKDAGRAAQLLEQLESEAGQAQETLAALSRGIYPPLLTERGLEGALRAEAQTLGLRCRVVTRDLGRYDLDLEAAVYFCCLEAMQNAAKHARGAEVELMLEERARELLFSVRDWGPGFAEAQVRAGSGLRNMRDRIEALGGQLQITASPGHGAWIVGRVGARTVAAAS